MGTIKTFFSNLWNDIVSFVEKNKVWIIVVSILVIILLILCLIISNLKDKNKILENNVKAATEQVDSLELANGQMLYDRQSYICKIDELENFIGVKKSEIKELEKKLSDKVIYIGDLEGKIDILANSKADTIFCRDTGDVFFKWEFVEPWYKVNGNTEICKNNLSTCLTGIQTYVPLQVGLTDDWRIFVTSENPYVSFTSIEGAVLDKDLYLKQEKKKPWGISVYAGFNMGYDLINKGFYAGPGIGIGVSYSLFSW